MTETEQPELIPVQILGTKGRSLLVQYKADGPQRCYVPKGKVVEGKCSVDVLEKGVVYGVQWEKMLDLSSITPERLAKILRRNGIWTCDDLEARDRKLIRIATNLIGGAVQVAAKRRQPLRRRASNASE